jgi:hypothetical protein
LQTERIILFFRQMNETEMAEREKKRETIVKKEYERRSRMNSYFDDIKDLLPVMKFYRNAI